MNQSKSMTRNGYNQRIIQYGPDMDVDESGHQWENLSEEKPPHITRRTVTNPDHVRSSVHSFNEAHSGALGKLRCPSV